MTAELDRRDAPFTTATAISYLRTHHVDIVPDTLRLWVRQGRIRVTRTVAGTCLYTRADLDALIAARRRREQERQRERGRG